ncbi:ankyrin repeat-containing domain protein [Pseudomassariella vexata]|uniref:Ankyrin repeat-containing domain protein n=1 Tax=Pseudomassariella vexata TaxID=1141098 RepID=A0A1Y2DTI6_9PEZI|nr:ankyrin repeat-containing domain protein [Pseudomassariella vexata]ORY62593.1 ankyrin repeat-containing domain protein [Pseudomassariella vexata]
MLEIITQSETENLLEFIVQHDFLEFWHAVTAIADREGVARGQIVARIKDNSGHTVGYYLTKDGGTESRDEERGLKGAIISGRDQEGNPPMMQAAHIGDDMMIRLLVHNCARVASINNFSETPIHIAARGSHISTNWKRNLNDPFIRHYSGFSSGSPVPDLSWTFLELSRSWHREHNFGNNDVENKGHISSSDWNSEATGSNAVPDATQPSETIDPFTCFVNQQNSFGQTTLHLACRLGNLGIVDAILATGHADIRLVDRLGHSALHLAEKANHGEMSAPDRNILEEHFCIPNLLARL